MQSASISIGLEVPSSLQETISLPARIHLPPFAVIMRHFALLFGQSSRRDPALDWGRPLMDRLLSSGRGYGAILAAIIEFLLLRYVGEKEKRCSIE